MPLPMAYITVILIWTTTPLAMKWSTEGVGFLFGVTARMGIGTIVAILICVMMRLALPLQPKAVLTYIVSGTGVYLTMFCTYWGVQFIPSGWISVLFGVTPIFTSVFTALYLGKGTVNLIRMSALCLGLTGLIMMFRESLTMGESVMMGVASAIIGVFVYSISMVAIKIINAPIKPVSTMTGTLIITTTLFLLSWLIGANQLPLSIPTKTAGSILYLGIMGSVIGFMLFFYVLQNVDTTRTALITLITPGCALILGNLLNHEPLTANIILGTITVISGLLLYEFGDAILPVNKNAPS